MKLLFLFICVVIVLWFLSISPQYTCVNILPLHHNVSMRGGLQEKTNPCANGGKVVHFLEGNYICNCKPGYDGTNCKGKKHTPTGAFKGRLSKRATMDMHASRSDRSENVNTVVKPVRTFNYFAIVFAVAVLLLYSICLAWSRRRDNLDRRKSVTVLEAYRSESRQAYMVTVFTGHRSGAGTTANIGIQITGTKLSSDPQVLKDPSRPVLQGHSDCWFLIWARESLGELTWIQLWSDYSGIRPSWYCYKIVVSDLATGQKYTFLFKCWLSVLHGDGSLRRLCKPSKEEDLIGMKYLFVDNLYLVFREDHLWLNMFLKHPRSSFTRCQRCSVAMVTFVLVLLFQMILHGVSTDDLSRQVDMDDNYSVRLSDFVTSLQGVLLSFPFTLFFFVLFRKCKPFGWEKQSRKCDTETEAGLEEIKPETGVEEDVSRNKYRGRDITELRKSRVDGEWNSRPISLFLEGFANLVLMDPLKPAEETLIDDQKVRYKDCTCNGDCICSPYRFKIHIKASENVFNKRRFPSGATYWFPSYMLYVAWILCFFTITVSTYFLLYCGVTSFYGLMRGFSWLTSVACAISVSILFFEPLKIILTTTVISYVYCQSAKTTFYPRDICGNINRPASDFFNHAAREQRRSKILLCRPLGRPEVEALRVRARGRKQLIGILTDLATYGVFYVALYVIVWGNRDSHAYSSTQNMRSMVEDGSAIDGVNFSDVTVMNEYIEYVNGTLLEGLYATEYYNGDPVQETGWMSDLSTHLLGVPRLRQLRVREGTCFIHKLFTDFVDVCFSEYGILTADTGDYKVGWKEDDRVKEDVGKEENEPWMFQSSWETGSHTLQGEEVYYPGGGYVATLGRTLHHSQTTLASLVARGWFDQRTRVVCVEFTAYSVNQNLFNVVTLMAERSPSGEWNLYDHVHTVRLTVIDEDRPFVLTLAYLTCGLYVALQLWPMCLLRCCRYFSSLRQFVDLCIALLLMIGVHLYAARIRYTSELLKRLEDAENSEFVGFTTAANYAWALRYVFAAIICIVTGRLWMLMRVFGDKFIVFETTLRSATASMLSLLLTVAILMLMFVLSTRILLSSVDTQFRDNFHALSTLLSFAIGFGEIDTDAVWRAHDVLGPVIYLVFTVTMSILLVNMFIAIIVTHYNLAYAAVSARETSDTPAQCLRDEVRCRLGLSGGQEGLRGGKCAVEKSVTRQKPDAIRNISSVRTTKVKLRAMLLLTLDFVKSFKVNRKRLHGRFEKWEVRSVQKATNERCDIMLLLAVDLMALPGEVKDVFYRGIRDESPVLVPEERLRVIVGIMNQLESVKTGDRVGFWNIPDILQSDEWIDEEFKLLKTQLSRLEACLNCKKFVMSSHSSEVYETLVLDPVPPRKSISEYVTSTPKVSTEYLVTPPNYCGMYSYVSLSVEANGISEYRQSTALRSTPASSTEPSLLRPPNNCVLFSGADSIPIVSNDDSKKNPIDLS